jgi:hypothetical protein
LRRRIRTGVVGRDATPSRRIDRATNRVFFGAFAGATGAEGSVVVPALQRRIGASHACGRRRARACSGLGNSGARVVGFGDGPRAARADTADSAGRSRIVTPAAVRLVEAGSRRERLARAAIRWRRRATIAARRTSGAARSCGASARAAIATLRAIATVVLARAAACAEDD